MADDIGWLSLLPPVLAIAVALWKKRVLPALFVGVIGAQLVLNMDTLYRVPVVTLEHMMSIAVLEGNFRLILFSLLIGALLKLIRDANGFSAFALAVGRLRRNFGPRTVFGTTYILGVLLFLEVWSNVLINGATVGSLYDRLSICRERLAYFIHTIGIATVAMVPINAWAAFYIGLLSVQGVTDPYEFIIRAIPFFLYSWVSLALVGFVMLTGWSIGPMQAFDQKAQQSKTPNSATEDQSAPTIESGDRKRPDAVLLMVALPTLILTTLTTLYLTGEGDITKGDGSKAILYAVLAAIIVVSALLLWGRVFRPTEIGQKIFQGMADFLNIAILIVLALSLGDLCKQMGTGPYVAQLADGTVPVFLLPAFVFVLAAGISFATGTSYGTFSIMVPIALPIASASAIDPALMFGACIAGGVFGDNCSPISDTTIVSSLAAEVKIIDHVRTQLPYALVSATLATLGFIILGAVLSG